MDSGYFLLQYLYNWDNYIPGIEWAPMPDSRRDKYNEIMKRYHDHVIDGSGVTCELAGWLANFDSESRNNFIDWIACQEKAPVVFIDNHQIKYQVIMSGDEMSVLKKSIKAAIDMEPLKESMRDAACTLYDKLNQI